MQNVSLTLSKVVADGSHKYHNHVCHNIWRFPEMGVPQNGWFIRESPSINGRFAGTSILGNPTIYKIHNYTIYCSPLRSLEIISNLHLPQPAVVIPIDSSRQKHNALNDPR